MRQLRETLQQQLKIRNEREQKLKHELNKVDIQKLELANKLSSEMNALSESSMLLSNVMKEKDLRETLGSSANFGGNCN